MSGEGVHNTYDDTALLVLLDLLQADIDLIEIDVNSILAKTNAIAVLEEIAGSLTTDGTEQTLYVNNAPAGIFIPICLKLNCTNQTATETIVLRTYYRIENGGNLIEQDTVTYVGVISPELLNIDLEPNRYGIHVTIEKTAGTNRAYDWEVFYEV